MRGEYRRRWWWWFPRWWELPPRARRILCTTADFCDVFGTTSACAENTHPHHPAAARPGNYLRVRGEYPKTFYLRVWLLELPPRARRIPAEVTADPRTLGTTSACAENTVVGGGGGFRGGGNYLRVRGEYCAQPQIFVTFLELPPRARRIHTLTTLPRHGRGTTSACAENTAKMQDTTGRPWNYLRVRGEYGEPHMPFDETRELPPRARRIRASRNNMKHITRTTSACAENTCGSLSGLLSTRNYLRVRGEYKFVGLREVTRQELPPRARRIPFVHPQKVRMLGTTSACAENTRFGR